MYRFITAGLLAIATITSANAESIAPFTGRTFGATDTEDLSVELGYILNSDGDAQAARINKSINERLQVYANYGLIGTDTELSSTDTEDLDGTTIGVGAFYKLPDFPYLSEYDAAIQIAYNTSEVETDTVTLEGLTGRVKGDLTVIALGLVFSSPGAISENGLKWYAGVGVERLGTDIEFAGMDLASDSETEPTAQGGLVLPTSFGSAFAGFHYSDGASYGVGLRYNF